MVQKEEEVKFLEKVDEDGALQGTLELKSKGNKPKAAKNISYLPHHHVGFMDTAIYKLGNLISARPVYRFYFLLVIVGCALFVLGTMWVYAVDSEGDNATTKDIHTAMYLVFQVLLTGGFDMSMHRPGERFVFFLMIIAGLSIVSILIGLIADTVSSGMNSLSDGSFKVVEKGHTLLLGWNEDTPRIITQIAFLRRTHKLQNKSRWRLVFPCLREKVKPESPVACGTIVVMNDTVAIEETGALVADAFDSAGIGSASTKIGRDLVFRRGDPTHSHDLMRVAAQEALSVCVMMSAVDAQECAAESEAGADAVANSATLRCVLALRNVLYSNPNHPGRVSPSLRVVLQLSRKFFPIMRSIPFLSSSSSQHDCLYPQDLSAFLAGLFFSCATRPCLSKVYTQLLDAEGPAIRCRPAHQLHAGPNFEKGWFVGKSMREALFGHNWRDGIVIGANQACVKDAGGGDYDYEEPPGLVSDPDRLIRSDDFVIFVGHTSVPRSQSVGGGGLAAYAEEAEKCLKVCIKAGGKLARRASAGGGGKGGLQKSVAAAGLKHEAREKKARSRLQQRKRTLAGVASKAKSKVSNKVPSRVSAAATVFPRDSGSGDVVVVVDGKDGDGSGNSGGGDGGDAGKRKEQGGAQHEVAPAVRFAVQGSSLGLEDDDDDEEDGSSSSSSEDEEDHHHKKPKHLLVCGWAQEWDTNPRAFLERCRETRTKGGLAPGSTITTANKRTNQEMAALFEPFCSLPDTATTASAAAANAASAVATGRRASRRRSSEVVTPFRRGPDGKRGEYWCKPQRLSRQKGEDDNGGREADGSGSSGGGSGAGEDDEDDSERQLPLQQQADSGPDGWLLDGGLELWHHCGDPTSVSDMAPLFEDDNGESEDVWRTDFGGTGGVEADEAQPFGPREITTAVCLGCGTGSALAATGSDSRVLATTLALQALTDRLRERTGVQRKLHIIAEHKQDETSILGSQGLLMSEGMPEDLINTESIVARSLAMNLAYPEIWDAVSELVSSDGGGPGRPDVVFMHPGEVGVLASTNKEQPLHEKPKSTALHFGALQQVLSALFNGKSVAIGYLAGSELVLGPAPTEAITWTPQHRIITITRSSRRRTSLFAAQAGEVSL